MPCILSLFLSFISLDYNTFWTRALWIFWRETTSRDLSLWGSVKLGPKTQIDEYIINVPDLHRSTPYSQRVELISLTSPLLYSAMLSSRPRSASVRHLTSVGQLNAYKNVTRAYSSLHRTTMVRRGTSAKNLTRSLWRLSLEQNSRSLATGTTFTDMFESCQLTHEVVPGLQTSGRKPLFDKILIANRFVNELD